MQGVETFYCAVCSTIKSESNHWFFLSAQDPTTFELTSFNNRGDGENGYFLCGASCIQKQLSRYLDEVNSKVIR